MTGAILPPNGITDAIQRIRFGYFGASQIWFVKVLQVYFSWLPMVIGHAFL